MITFGHERLEPAVEVTTHAGHEQLADAGADGCQNQAILRRKPAILRSSSYLADAGADARHQRHAGAESCVECRGVVPLLVVAVADAAAVRVRRHVALETDPLGLEDRNLAGEMAMWGP